MAFKFRHKILLALSSIVLLALSIFLAISLWRLQKSAEERVRQGLENAKAAFYLSREQQGKAVADAVESLASTNPELRAVLASRGSSGSDPFADSADAGNDELQVLESSLPFLPLYAHADQFIVRDRDGKVLLAKEKSGVPEEEVPAVAKEALAGKVSYDWWKGEKNTLQVFAAPVLLQNSVLGAISVGYRIDQQFLEPLAKISQTNIELAAPGESTAAGVAVVEKNGARFLESYVPIQAPSGRVVGAFRIQRSVEAEMRDAIALRNNLMLTSVLVLFFAITLALYLASLVSRPLEALGKAVREIGAGNFAFRTKSTSRDEFGTLARTIDEMAAGLEERERIRATFNRYVDGEVVTAILKEENAETLSGAERFISVLFADLANFTSFSEGKRPDELLRNLNGYFGAMSKLIDEEKGILDKFIGDAVMAYWGAPVDNPFHAELACRTALRQAKMFREEFLPQYPGLGLRIGISTGDALVGNVGSEKRQNFTVMGDTVNLASRLEGVNKTFGTMICVSEKTKTGLESAFLFRLLGRVKVAGRAEAEKVYELLGDSGHPGAALVKTYEEALALFEDSDLIGAAALVEGFAQDGDGPSKALLARCRDPGSASLRNPDFAVWSLSK